jgi:amyloid beta precursor protein binding protein 1
MTSDSDSYMALQRVYVAKAREDMATLATRAGELLAMIGKPADAISEQELRLFCKNAAFLVYRQGSPLAKEYDAESFRKDEHEFLLEADDSPLALYMMLRASDRFFTSTGHHPGRFDEMVEDDVRHLSGCISALLSEWGLSSNIKDELVGEVCRYGGAELHAVAAFIGGETARTLTNTHSLHSLSLTPLLFFLRAHTTGIASQEVIKLVTQQYVPLNNTFIFNGITTSSAQFSF